MTVKALLASTVQVQVNDAGSFLSQGPSAVPPHVLVGVWDGHGGFHPALEVQKTSSGITFQASIPYDTPLRLQVQSKHVVLQDSNQQLLPASGSSAIFSSDSSKSPAQQPVFAYTAIGRNP